MNNLALHRRAHHCVRPSRQVASARLRSRLASAAAADHSKPGPDISDGALRDVRVVLVSPKSQTNVGAVARCCANFEVGQLCIVDPRCDVAGDEAFRLACNAEDVLKQAMIVPSLEEALAETSASIGFTRRSGATRFVHASLVHMVTDFPESIPGTPTSPDGRGGAGMTALVFGREESGLTEGELKSLSFACSIPTGRRQGSLNLSHAVSVILGEVFQRRWMIEQGDAHLLKVPLPASDEGSSLSEQNLPSVPNAQQDQALLPASLEEIELLLKKVSAIAVAAGVSGEESHGGSGNHGRRRLPLGNLRAVFQRARVNRRESRSFHGLASAVLNVVDPDNQLEQKKNLKRSQKSEGGKQ